MEYLSWDLTTKTVLLSCTVANGVSTHGSRLALPAFVTQMLGARAFVIFPVHKQQIHTYVFLDVTKDLDADDRRMNAFCWAT